jgi:hypothetical protein
MCDSHYFLPVHQNAVELIVASIAAPPCWPRHWEWTWKTVWTGREGANSSETRHHSAGLRRRPICYAAPLAKARLHQSVSPMRSFFRFGPHRLDSRLLWCDGRRFKIRFNNVNLGRVQEWIDAGRLDPSAPITIKHLKATPPRWMPVSSCRHCQRHHHATPRMLVCARSSIAQPNGLAGLGLRDGYD